MTFNLDNPALCKEIWCVNSEKFYNMIFNPAGFFSSAISFWLGQKSFIKEGLVSSSSQGPVRSSWLVPQLLVLGFQFSLRDEKMFLDHHRQYIKQQKENFIFFFYSIFGSDLISDKTLEVSQKMIELIFKGNWSGNYHFNLLLQHPMLFSSCSTLWREMEYTPFLSCMSGNGSVAF